MADRRDSVTFINSKVLFNTISSSSMNLNMFIISILIQLVYPDSIFVFLNRSQNETILSHIQVDLSSFLGITTQKFVNFDIFITSVTMLKTQKFQTETILHDEFILLLIHRPSLDESSFKHVGGRF